MHLIRNFANFLPHCKWYWEKKNYTTKWLMTSVNKSLFLFSLPCINNIRAFDSYSFFSRIVPHSFSNG